MRGKHNAVFNDDISLVLCGAAGQGVQTVEQLLTDLLKKTGYHLFATKEYMSRVRGGSNSTELRVSSKRVKAFVDRIDILFPLNREALNHVEKRLTEDTVILGEKEKLITDEEADALNIIDIPFSQIAAEIGGAIYANIIAAGVIASLFGIDRNTLADYLQERFGNKGEAVVAKNIEAVGRGFEIGRELVSSGRMTINLKKDEAVRDDIVISGGEAISMGAIAGGCNFISSYPMTPSTAVLTFLAQHSSAFDIIAEQAEDEIAAINMAIGAWYAGAHAMVTTSGGGFALMEEGVSLAGIIESPIVIHLAQRPGPATGLPTRTEQGDLELAIYSGHGEFPRIVYAPGTLEDGFQLARKAFDMADKHQAPVFVLSDQYFIDSYYNIPKIDASGITVNSHVVKTSPDYRRYRITENGISPRGIPGYGEGLVMVDSDEHDEDGHITENHDMRIAMFDKRMKKLNGILEEALPPEIIGDPDAETMIICWGSTFPITMEAVFSLGRDDVSLAYFKQVFPLGPDVRTTVGRAKKHIIVENNGTAQFARILKLWAGVDSCECITKYNGLAFSVEELAARLRGVL